MEMQQPPSQRQSLLRRCCRAWDPVENVKSLWERDPRAIPQLDGLRLFACLWVVAFHVILDTVHQFLGARPDLMPYFTENMYNEWWYRLVVSGDLGVDIFFVLSGFLIAYILMSEVDRSGGSATGTPERARSCWSTIFCLGDLCGGIRYWRFLARRWLRLMPAFLFAIPTTLTDEGAWSLCKDWGWANLLLINNFAGPGTYVMGCLLQSWSIAMEYQFYIISPLVIVLATRSAIHNTATKRFYGWTVFVAFFIISIAIRAALLLAFDPDLSLMYTNHYPLPGKQYPRQVPAFVTVLYTKTYARFGPYALGMLTAYLYRYNMKHAQKLVNPSPSKSTFGSTRCCDGRGSFQGYLNAKEAVCKPALCCRGRRFQGADEMEVSLLEKNIAFEVEEPERAADSAQSPAPLLPRSTMKGHVAWFLAASLVVAIGIALSVYWPMFSSITQSPIFLATRNIPLRRFAMITWRSMVAATTCGIILICLIQRGYWVDALLSWKGWVPFARLTYSVYLLQMAPIKWFGFGGDLFQRMLEDGTAAIPASCLAFLAQVLVIYVATFGLSFAMYLVVEKPAMNLRIK